MVQSFSMRLGLGGSVLALLGSLLGSVISWASPQSELYESFRQRDAAPSAKNVQAWRDLQEKEKRTRERPAKATLSPSKVAPAQSKTGTKSVRTNPTRTSKIPSPKVSRPPSKASQAAPGIDGSSIPRRLEF